MMSMIEKITIGLLVISFGLALFNVSNLIGLQSLGIVSAPVTGLVSASSGEDSSASTAPVARLDVSPKGTPEVYGAELQVSFDDVSPNTPSKADAAIKKLAVLDQSITLEGDDLSRYTKITNSISCEYCCGAPAITDAEGNPACGCAHSYAMRGLAKYLITQHGDEFSDEQILEELGKWKTLFFPDNLGAKAAVLQSKNIPLNYISLASNQYRGIENQSTSSNGQMVGGC